MKALLIRLSLDHPNVVIVVCAVLTILAGLQVGRVHVDTDPENMLPEDEPIRVFHDEVKETFGLHDFLVVGIVHPVSAFNPTTLARVARLTDSIRDLDKAKDE